VMKRSALLRLLPLPQSRHAALLLGMLAPERQFEQPSTSAA
jgi:hypothetical protein